MTIELMVNVSEPNALNKVTNVVDTLEGTLRNESPISRPSILVETDSLAVGSTVRANYAHIPSFGRYYYIKEVTHVRNHLWMLDLVCDVLMSFSTGIKASMVLIEQTTDVGNARVNDYMTSDSYAATVKDKTDIIQFPDGFADTPYFILITAGGVIS